MHFLAQTIFSIIILPLACTVLCNQTDQPAFVAEWNNHVNPANQTISFSSDNRNNTVLNNNLLKSTLFWNGLVSAECAKRFPSVRTKKEYENQYAGPYVISNGPVNNRDAERYAFVRLILAINMFKPALRVLGALPYAFDYQAEATQFINLLSHFNKEQQSNNDCQIKCLQTICYGFHSVACGIHALCSPDANARQLREKLNIKDCEANRLLAPISLIIVQAPMMRLSDPVACITKQSIPYFLFMMQMVFFGLTMWLDFRHNNINKNTITLLYAIPLLMNIMQCSTKAKEQIVSCITFIINHYAMPYLVTHSTDYQADVVHLFDNLNLNHNFRNLTLVVTHQKYDEFVGPLKDSDKNVLEKVFPNVVFVKSKTESHLYESDVQKAVQNTIRQEKGLPYINDNNLLALCKTSLKNNPKAKSRSPVQHTAS